MSGGVWFTSDLHLGHNYVAKLRGFTSTDEHDQAILDNWDRVVRPDDQVWVLGDLTMSNPAQALQELRGLPGRKHLIAGNHDACHPMHRSAHNRQRAYLATFESVQAFARRRILGREALLSHFPYSADHTTDARFMQYRLRDEGALLLHGHTHGPERRHGHEIHVGLDAWGMTPVALHQIERLAQEVPA
jgi:calcineurin-like phosphoesterase family protein